MLLFSYKTHISGIVSGFQLLFKYAVTTINIYVVESREGLIDDNYISCSRVDYNITRIGEIAVVGKPRSLLVFMSYTEMLLGAASS